MQIVIAHDAGMATKKRGRKSDPSSTSGKIRDLLKQGVKPMDIAKKLNCAPPLVYNVRARMAGGPAKKSVTKAKVGRPAKAAVGDLGDLGGILAAVQNGEKDRIRMRRALEQIQSVITSALA
tara:strand:+ start:225 stop:590 length:366 start_codon:yes stop_codon:yes gene_type:complete